MRPHSIQLQLVQLSSLRRFLLSFSRQSLHLTSVEMKGWGRHGQYSVGKQVVVVVVVVRNGVLATDFRHEATVRRRRRPVDRRCTVPTDGRRRSDAGLRPAGQRRAGKVEEKVSETVFGLALD